MPRNVVWSGLAVPVLLAAAVLVLYGLNVGRLPSYLYVDEVVFALQAHSIATTAHDTNGRLLPLYFQMRPIGDNVWFQPLIVYFMTLFLTVLPLTESTIRLPSVVVGAIDVVLMYFIAKRIFVGQRWAIVAAMLLALTPAHFIHSRIAMDYLYPVPFVMAWLLSLLIFLERNELRMLFVAASALGVGFFSYIASVIMMPVYLLLTWLTLFRTSTKSKRPYLVAAVGFIWPLVIAALWLSYHWSVVVETLSKYQVGTYQARASIVAGGPLATVLQELRRPVHFSDLTGRISLYWYFFDPSFLFLMGGYAHVVNSTRRVGIFLLPLLVFLPVGLARIATLRRTQIDRLLLLGFVSAPLAACLVVPEPYAIDRELVLLPFAVLIATCGVEYMWAARQRHWRIAGVCLLALIPLHFAFFCVDYWRDYPLRSAYWFQGNRRGALEEIIAREPRDQPPAIYLETSRILYVNAHWQLYLLKHKRQDLLQRTVYFESKSLDVQAVPARSLLLMTNDDVSAEALVERGQIRRVETFPEPGNPPAFALFQK